MIWSFIIIKMGILNEKYQQKRTTGSNNRNQPSVIGNLFGRARRRNTTDRLIQLDRQKSASAVKVENRK